MGNYICQKKYFPSRLISSFLICTGTRFLKTSTIHKHKSEDEVMAASRIEAVLAQLQDEVSNCEKALLKLIQVKKTMFENAPLI